MNGVPHYREIAAEIARKYREVVASGVDPASAREVLMRAEAQLCAMEMDSLRAFTALHREVGTSILAERQSKSPSQIRRDVANAVNKIAHEMAKQRAA